MHHPRPPSPCPSSPRPRAHAGRHRALALVVAPGLLLLATSCGEVILRADPDAGTQPGAPDGAAPGGPDAALSAVALADSFEITATLTYDGGIFVPIELLPKEHAFVLRLDDALPGITEAIAGTAGQVTTGRFDRVSDGRRRLRDSLSLGTSGVAACGLGNLSYESMDIEVYDDDGDGRPDRLQGTAAGSLESFLGDIVGFVELEATLTGRRDDTPPTLAFAGPATEQSVFGNVLVMASEPLAAGATVAMRSPDGDVSVDMIPFPDGQAEAVAYFYTQSAQLLPFGATLAVSPGQDVTDLAGNALGSVGLALETIPDPGPFVQDGFEDTANVHLRGDARLIVDSGADGELPTIGVRSLYLGPGGSATFRIPVDDADDADELSLLMSMRGLSNQSGAVTISGGVGIGTPDGSVRSNSGFPELDTTVALDHEDWSFISPNPPEIMAIALPPLTGGELVVEVRVDSPVCAIGSQPRSAGVIIDEVRVQPPLVVEPLSVSARAAP